MQKAFGRAERVAVILAIIGLILRLLFWKGAAVSLLSGLAFLSLLYFVGGYFQIVKPGVAGGASVTLVKIMSGLAFSIMAIGLMFRLLFWNGGVQMMLVGIPATLIAIIAALQLSKPEYKLVSIVRRGTAWLVLGMAIQLTGSIAFFRLFHRNDPVLVQKYAAMITHERNPQYRAEYEAYRREKSHKNKP